MKFSVLADPSIVQYVRNICVRETQEQVDLRNETSEKLGDYSIMISSPEQMQLLQIILKLIGAKNILEIGCFTGYSALCFALATSDTNAKITTLDVSEEYVQIGRQYWKKAGVEDRIEAIIKPALESLEELKQSKQLFDFVFIDADKVNYPKYVEMVYELVRPNGLVVIDNTLWSGKVLDEQDQTADTIAIRETNNKCRDDQRWDIAMETIADGCTFLRKK
ncbi:hypothetical protein C9374_010716 [Naegleria lovaniensis]|uniref:O-methyltransferase n=1 Tax=Naegleria lovaniensis TaxID=51637 RepID=A0AA88GB42_NAELO|nr:uncharacterized protein C9374_010716 [Naegleria lovaniensis]KAG2374432.1 hypothetical protein C9374_010716 [Naegleria lovaniensis]